MKNSTLESLYTKPVNAALRSMILGTYLSNGGDLKATAARFGIAKLRVNSIVQRAGFSFHQE